MATIREHKGKSLLQFPNDFIVIDIETTGLDPRWDSIIELSALKVRDNQVVDTFDTLVNPHCEIGNFISELTGITDEMLADAPDIKDVLPVFYEFIGNDILMGHSVHFDINFLYDNLELFIGEKLTNDFVDTLRLSRRIMTDLEHHRLVDIASAFNVFFENSHRALPDCNTTFKCYYKLREKIKEQYQSEENFINKYGSYYRCDLRKIIAQNTEFDISHPLYKKNCVFTGKLEKMKRKEAAQYVVNLGGFCENGVTKLTNFLILGNNDYCSTIKDGKSNKHKKAEEYKLKGSDIEILSENVFYELLEIGGECSAE